MEVHTQSQTILSLLQEVYDPEIPALSIVDLGIVRAVQTEGDTVEIIITPTYSGCPAMDAITFDIRLKMIEHGYSNCKITSVLSPAWTTDWMTEHGRQQLKLQGIAPPNTRQQACNNQLFAKDEAIQCPLCESYNTTLISQFGSTACKSLHQCQTCKEPFDYFKCH